MVYSKGGGGGGGTELNLNSKSVNHTSVQLGKEHSWTCHTFHLIGLSKFCITLAATRLDTPRESFWHILMGDVPVVKGCNARNIALEYTVCVTVYKGKPLVCYITIQLALTWREDQDSYVWKCWVHWFRLSHSSNTCKVLRFQGCFNLQRPRCRYGRRACCVKDSGVKFAYRAIRSGGRSCMPRQRRNGDITLSTDVDTSIS